LNICSHARDLKKSAAVNFLVLRLMHEGPYRRFPGTNINKQLRAPATAIIHATITRDRLIRSLRTYGSLMRANDMNVYSLKPAMATMGSVLKR